MNHAYKYCHQDRKLFPDPAELTVYMQNVWAGLGLALAYFPLFLGIYVARMSGAD
jgi:hypothetical protein